MFDHHLVYLTGTVVIILNTVTKRKTRCQVPSIIQVITNTEGTRVILVDSNHHLWTWGNNKSLLGLGSLTEFVPEPRIIASVRFIQISIGANHCLALDESYNLWNWGDNSAGQIAGSSAYPIMTTEQYRWINAHRLQSSGLDLDDKLVQWGNHQARKIIELEARMTRVDQSRSHLLAADLDSKVYEIVSDQLVKLGFEAAEILVGQDYLIFQTTYQVRVVDEASLETKYLGSGHLRAAGWNYYWIEDNGRVITNLSPEIRLDF